MTTTIIRAGVVGHPVAHSLSPHIHRTWMQRAEINGTYELIDVEPSFDAFNEAMNRLRDEGFAGVNVTIPHKENALRYADYPSAAAQRVGAANTLFFRDDGVHAENTDIIGFSASLKESGGIFSEASSALVLGAGGAARGVIEALKLSGVGRIIVTNRTADKAAALSDIFDAETVDWTARSEVFNDVDVLVNTTSLGMHGFPPLDIEVEHMSANAVVADIVYNPLETNLLVEAKKRGLKTADGLAMLMHQAVPGFEGWYGVRPVVDQALRDHLISILDKREKS